MIGEGIEAWIAFLADDNQSDYPLVARLPEAIGAPTHAFV